MMRRIAVALALALTVALSGGSSSGAGFRSVLQVSVGGAPAAYSGPGDVVSGAHIFWAMRGYNAAFSGAVASVCDAATGLVCADATWAAGALSLPLIGGVACNNATNICQIATLYDQIGGNNCGGASCNITQATTSKRPTLVIAGAANGCTTTAFPCAAFVRASSQCLAGANAYTQALPLTVLVTANRTGTVASQQTALSFANATRTTGWSGANIIRMFFAASSPINTLSGVNDSSWHSLQYVVSDSVGAFGVDATTTAANTGTNSPAAAPTLGSTSAAGACTANAFDGVMTEAGVWPVAFTAQQVLDMSANVRGYWGF